MHNSWDENYQRGYEWWLMVEAKKVVTLLLCVLPLSVVASHSYIVDVTCACVLFVFLFGFGDGLKRWVIIKGYFSHVFLVSDDFDYIWWVNNMIAQRCFLVAASFATFFMEGL